MHITPDWQDASGGFPVVTIVAADHLQHIGGPRGIEARMRQATTRPAASDPGEALFIKSTSQQIALSDTTQRLWLKSLVSQFDAVISLSVSATTLMYTPPWTGSAPYPIDDRLAEKVSVTDFFGSGSNGSVSPTATQMADFTAFLHSDQHYPSVVWPSRTYSLPSTLVLNGVRGLSFLGEGSNTTEYNTRITVQGTGAGHHGVMQLISVTDFFCEGLEFIVSGTGADQCVELMANDTPDLSCLLHHYIQCNFRRFSTTPEFIKAALNIRNSAMMEFIGCVFPVSAVAMRLGEDGGIEPNTFGDGLANTIKIEQCHFFGDIERRNVLLMNYERNFFDRKTSSSPSTPSCMTVSGVGRTRQERVIGNFVDPQTSDWSRTFYTQGNAPTFSGGLIAEGNQLSEVAIAFDIPFGQADIGINNFQQSNAGDIGVRIGSSAHDVKVSTGNNWVPMLAAGGIPIQDNRASAERDGILLSRQPSPDFTSTQTNVMETAATFASVQFPGGRICMSYSATILAGAANTAVKLRLKIGSTAVNASLRRALVLSAEYVSISSGPIYAVVAAGAQTVTLEMEQGAASPNFPTLKANSPTLGGSYVNIEVAT